MGCCKDDACKGAAGDEKRFGFKNEKGNTRRDTVKGNVNTEEAEQDEEDGRKRKNGVHSGLHLRTD